MIKWKDINIEQPNTGDDIISLTSVGQMKGSYINGDIFRTTGRNGSLYSFTKWKLYQKKPKKK